MHILIHSLVNLGRRHKSKLTTCTHLSLSLVVHWLLFLFIPRYKQSTITPFAVFSKKSPVGNCKAKEIGAQSQIFFGKGFAHPLFKFKSSTDCLAMFTFAYSFWIESSVSVIIIYIVCANQHFRNRGRWSDSNYSPVTWTRSVLVHIVPRIKRYPFSYLETHSVSSFTQLQ